MRCLQKVMALSGERAIIRQKSTANKAIHHINKPNLTRGGATRT